MDVILLQDVQTLGTAGDIVKVKPGYARNYLFPRGFALRSSKRNRAVAKEKKRNIEMSSKRIEQANMSLVNKINKIANIKDPKIVAIPVILDTFRSNP